MKNIKFILASASPRRHDLLNTIGIEHEIFVTDADETPHNIDPTLPYAECYALEASKLKAEAAVAEFPAEKTAGYDYTVFISADTVVSPDGNEVFGKPADESDAARMLGVLSGGEHFVIGGITVSVLKDGVLSSFSSTVTTKVSFKKLSERETMDYIASGEPFGKAGAYAIQGLGSAFVSGICGDYPNVVGISLFELCRILKDSFGLEITDIRK